MESIRCEISCQKGKHYTAQFPLGPEGHTEDAFSVRVTEETAAGCRAGHLTLRLNVPSHTESWALDLDAPVRLWLPATPPRAVTAFYLYNPWWTRPAFCEGFGAIPRRTQVVLFQYPDRVGCFVPMVGKTWKAWLAPGTDTALALELSCGVAGFTAVDEPLYLYAEAPTAEKAIHTVFARLAMEKGIALREERRLPGMFRYLGWCSWDAFYREISEEGVRRKAEELTEKGVPVRWMLVDDGWLSVRYDTEQLTDFAPDGEKFPHGFGPLAEELRTQHNIPWLGVWHALAGFWGGVAPGSAAANIAADALLPTLNGKLVPSPDTGTAFYRRWYELLRRQGIRFAKVDGQSSVPNYFENTRSTVEAAAGLGRALEGGAAVLDGAVLNCMGMAMESILGRTTSALSRNSDDFLPRKEGSFVEHLLQNAYNALYHNEFYVCDWDMFWTHHPDAGKHALLRAISGGPVYVSDRVGETDAAVLRPLACRDGRLLMMDRSAKPAADCIFRDPRKDGVLKLHNACPWGGGLAVYNLTDTAQTFSFTAADIPELDGSQPHWVYDWFARKAVRLAPGARFEGTVEAGGYGWYPVLPAGRRAALLGLVQKYVGFAALETVQKTDAATLFVVREQGPLGWLAENRPRRVTVNAVDCTDLVQQDGVLFTLPLPENSGKAVVVLEWDRAGQEPKP
ncbi:Sip1-related alpha-galactosidase [Subdoligranulum variabile]|uniref:Sip1-related alpha-galactosidase n=1 Tax=Subdoligranulum variabile TaxID=214851 RepID=UPI0026EB4359|nr:Sip1-related alpha-galactosidase [Subdoligranulum variabile]